MHEKITFVQSKYILEGFKRLMSKDVGSSGQFLRLRTLKCKPISFFHGFNIKTNLQMLN